MPIAEPPPTGDGPTTVLIMLARVEGKLDVIAAKLDEHGTDLRDHEERIRSLERGRWPLPSLAALVSIAALVLALLGYLTRN